MRNKILLCLFVIGVIIFCTMAGIEARKADQCLNIEDSSIGEDLEMRISLGDSAEINSYDTVTLTVTFKNRSDRNLFINPNWIEHSNYIETVQKAKTLEGIKDGEFARMRSNVMTRDCNKLQRFTNMIITINVNVEEMQKEMVEIKPGEEVSYSLNDVLYVYWTDIDFMIKTYGDKQFKIYLVYTNNADPWGSDMVWKGTLYSNLVSFKVKEP